MSTLKVTVIVPTHNAEDSLEQLLESLRGLDYPKELLEILIVDNNSTDGTVSIASRFPLTVLHEKERQSSYAARNRGIRHASGEVLAFTDSDCVVDPKWLRELLAEGDDPSLGCFAGRIVSFSPQTLAEQFADLDEENHNQERSLSVGYLPSANTANVAYRREVFDRIGLFDQNLKSGGDAELTWRMKLKTDYRISYQNDAIVLHRHRATLRSLFSQHIRYGEGITDLQNMYPGSCVSLLWFFQDIFRHFFFGMYRLPRNLWRFARGEGGGIDIWFDFIKAYCRVGLSYGRLKGYAKKSNGEYSVVPLFHFLFSRTLKRLKIPPSR